MAHIELAAPVSHIWYFKGIPSRMGLLLDMSPRALEEILYFAAYVVTDSGNTPLEKKQLLSEKEYRTFYEKYGNAFRAEMGAEAVRRLLQDIDIDKEILELKEELKTVQGQRRTRAIRRLEVMEAFRNSGNDPAWMVLDVLPVIPPEIRPMVQLDGGRFATSDLNDLYRRVINRNNRLKRLLDLGAPGIIVQNEKRMLRSEEHTSELQSRGHLVCRLLLEKKKKRRTLEENEKSISPSTSVQWTTSNGARAHIYTAHIFECYKQ